MATILDSFFRSSAAWRVRIALALKGIDHALRPRDFRAGEQRSPAFLAINPQGLVPALTVDGTTLSQSLAIVEYLDETCPRPALLPADPIARAQVRAMAQLIACDIHPIDNLRVLTYLRQELAADEETVNRWYRHWIALGLEALEVQARALGNGERCFGDAVTLADICLVPQMYNARRFDTDLAPYPTLVAIDASLRTLPPFATTAPEQQPDRV